MNKNITLRGAGGDAAARMTRRRAGVKSRKSFYIGDLAIRPGLGIVTALASLDRYQEQVVDAAKKGLLLVEYGGKRLSPAELEELFGMEVEDGIPDDGDPEGGDPDDENTDGGDPDGDPEGGDAGDPPGDSDEKSTPPETADTPEESTDETTTTEDAGAPEGSDGASDEGEGSKDGEDTTPATDAPPAGDPPPPTAPTPGVEETKEESAPEGAGPLPEKWDKLPKKKLLALFEGRCEVPEKRSNDSLIKALSAWEAAQA